MTLRDDRAHDIASRIQNTRTTHFETDFKTLIKKLGNREKIVPQRHDKRNTPTSHRLTHLHRSHWKHSTFPIIPKSDVLLGHHLGEAGEAPLISGHVSRATRVDQPKALHASHLKNKKQEGEWAKHSTMRLVQNESNQCLSICSKVRLGKSILSLLGGTPTRPLGGLRVPWK
jgi:hypothetical protein